jgi:hypothetical protein
VDEVEEVTLVRGSRSAALTRSGSRRRRGRLQAAHVPLELGAGEPAAATDADRAKVAGLHECEDRRAAEAEDLRGFLWRQQQGVTVRPVATLLRFGRRSPAAVSS